jgi:hypothetical protein
MWPVCRHHVDYALNYGFFKAVSPRHFGETTLALPSAAV